MCMKIFPWSESMFKFGFLTLSTRIDSRVSTAEQEELKYRKDASINSLLQIFQKEIKPPAYSSSQVTLMFWINKFELRAPLHFPLVVCDRENIFQHRQCLWSNDIIIQSSINKEWHVLEVACANLFQTQGRITKYWVIHWLGDYQWVSLFVYINGPMLFKALQST